MKIRDLFEDELPTTDTKLSYYDAKARIKKAGGEEVGSGAFGTVFTVPKDIETIVKVSQLANNKWDEDGYYNYINKIKDIKNETHNVYLPQIYEIIRMKPDREHKVPYLMVNLERLYSVDDIAEDEGSEYQLLLVLGRMVGMDKARRAVKDHKKRYRMSEIDTIIDLITEVLDWNAEVHNKPYDLTIRDSELLAAIKLIKKLRSMGFTIDIHAKNFMFRRTPYGLQLVLTDPLSFRDSGRVKLKTTKQ